MQRIKNIDEVILQLKPLLRKYLEEHHTVFKNQLFQCPNRAEHKNSDETPSAGFIPNTEDTIWNCFSCGSSSDIFGAYKFLENKEINGAHWFMAVKDLADRYGIYCELEALKPEEQEFNNVQTFLKTLIATAHNHLIKKKPKEIIAYVKKRGWDTIIDHFEIGYIPDTQEVRKFIASSFEKYPEISKHLSVNIDKPDNFTNMLTNRLIYPIKHRYGYILGLVNRTISDNDSRPKYIKYFTKQNEKGGTLFNLTKTYKTVYIVEGASSVFTLYANGVKNVVAISGSKFTEIMYQSLIKHGIERIIFCFDGDEAGLGALNRAIKITQNKSDAKIFIKLLTDNKDPDDFIKAYGVKEFVNIPEVSNFKHQLGLFKEANEENQKELKESVFEIIINSKDAIIRERMLKLFTSEIGVLKTTLVEELEKYEKTKGLIADVGVSEILKEESSLVKSIEAFEEKAWRSGKLKGISTGYPIFDEKMDGLQTGLVLIAGKWNTGKSAFMQSLALNMLNDPTNYILYFSVDDPVVGTTIPRFIANLSHIPINTVSNPLYRIDKNETLEDTEKTVLKEKRNEAITKLKGYSGRLGLKDATEGYDTSFVEKIIKVYKVAAGERKLIIFVDFLNMVSLTNATKSMSTTDIETKLAGFFKHMAGLYDVPVICTVESTKGVSNTRMNEGDIKGSASLQYRSDLTLLLSSDFEASQKSEMYFYDDEGVAQPVVQVRVSKSKMSDFRKSIYFKFYRLFSKFEECSLAEQQEFLRKG